VLDNHAIPPVQASPPLGEQMSSGTVYSMRAIQPHMSAPRHAPAPSIQRRAQREEVKQLGGECVSLSESPRFASVEWRQALVAMRSACSEQEMEARGS